MTSKPKCWPPEPGSGLWTDRLGRLWEPYQRAGLLRNPSSGEVRDADEVWCAYGPLIMPAALAAALRRHGHELECAAAGPLPAERVAEVEARYARADRVDP